MALPNLQAFLLDEALRDVFNHHVLEFCDTLSLLRLKEVCSRDECTRIIDGRLTDRNQDGTVKASCVFRRANTTNGTSIQAILPKEYPSYAFNISFSVPLWGRNGQRNGRHMSLFHMTCGNSGFLMEVNAWNAEVGALRFCTSEFDMYSDLPVPHALGRGFNDGRTHELVVLIEHCKVLMFVDGNLVSDRSHRHLTELPRPAFDFQQGQPQPLRLTVHFGHTQDGNTQRSFTGSLQSVSFRAPSAVRSG